MWCIRLPSLVAAEIEEKDVTFLQPSACGKGDQPFSADNSTGAAWRQEETMQMLIGQLHNEYWCGVEIEKYTKATGASRGVCS